LRIASAQALAMATVTETPFFLAARSSASGRAWTVTWKVGMVSEAVMVAATAFSMAFIGRPSPGTFISGIGWPATTGATAAAPARACWTSAAVIAPSGPLPFTSSRFTPSSPASLRA